MATGELRPASSPRRIVTLVDCYHDECEMYADSLGALGYQVLVVETGDSAEACQLVVSTRADAIVLRMGRGDGIALLRDVQAHTQGRRVPIVVLTTDVDPAQWKRARDEGASAVFLLPMSPTDLAAALRGFIDPGQTRGVHVC